MRTLGLGSLAWPVGIAAAFAITLVACSKRKSPAPEQTAAVPVAAASACRPVTFERTSFTVCTALRSRHRVRLVLDGPDGTALRKLDGLAPVLRDDLARTAFAMNAGMFDATGEPIGLFVADGRERRALNRRSGKGNFHLLPNGVFWGDDAGWHVDSADDYAQRAPNPIFATQSGPMLVIAGKLHPAFEVDGASHYIRNGVGITRGGDAVFAIGDAPVSFGRFARLFRDALDCRNALYFDGSVSQLWDPAIGRLDAGPRIGPMVVAIERSTPARHAR